MRVIWGRDDVFGGRILKCQVHNHKAMIGYKPEDDGTGNYYFIVSLEDGLISPAYTKESLAAVLTHRGWIPDELREKK